MLGYGGFGGETLPSGGYENRTVCFWCESSKCENSSQQLATPGEGSKASTGRHCKQSRLDVRVGRAEDDSYTCAPLRVLCLCQRLSGFRELLAGQKPSCCACLI